jgi:plasmid maintenance system antidote protein VapI
MFMSNRLRSQFLKGFHLAVATIADVAEGIGRGYRSVQAYVRDERRVTPDAARRMAAYLRDRANAMNQVADSLEEAAEEEERRTDEEA